MNLHWWLKLKEYSDLFARADSFRSVMLPSPACAWNDAVVRIFILTETGTERRNQTATHNSDKPSRQHQIINARYATRALLALWSHISVSVHFKLVFLVQVNFRLTALNVVDFWLLFRGGACCLLLFREHLQKYYCAFFTQRRAQRCVAIV